MPDRPYRTAGSTDRPDQPTDRTVLYRLYRPTVPSDHTIPDRLSVPINQPYQTDRPTNHTDGPTNQPYRINQQYLSSDHTIPDRLSVPINQPYQTDQPTNHTDRPNRTDHTIPHQTNRAYQPTNLKHTTERVY